MHRKGLFCLMFILCSTAACDRAESPAAPTEPPVNATRIEPEGKPMRRAPAPAQSTTTSPLASDRAFFAGDIVDVTSGVVLSHIPGIDKDVRCRVRDEHMVYAVTHPGHLVAIDLDTLSVLWDISLGSAGCIDVGVTKDAVAVLDDTRTVRSFARVDGKSQARQASSTGKEIYQLIGLEKHIVVRREDSTLAWLDPSTLNTLEITEAPEDGGHKYLDAIARRDPHTLCSVTLGDDSEMSRVRCFDDDAREIWTRALHARLPVEGTVLAYQRTTESYLVFNSTWHTTDHPQVQVLNAADGTDAAQHNVRVNMVATDNQGALSGFLAVSPEEQKLSFLDPGTGLARWTVEVLDWARGGTAIVDQGKLYVALFHPMSTGAALHAFDVSTGKLLWSADVERLEVKHSKYSNNVEIELREDAVMIWGKESAGMYLQVFDASSGARRYSKIDKRW